MEIKFIKKNIWRLYPILILVGILLYFHFNGKKMNKKFYNNSLNNIVVKSNNWQGRVKQFILNNDIKIESSVIDSYNIMVGDSIVKDSKSYIFRIYRKENDGKYIFIKQYTLEH